MKYIQTHGDELRLFRWARKYLYKWGLVRYPQRPVNSEHHALLDTIKEDISVLSDLKRKEEQGGATREDFAKVLYHFTRPGKE